MYYHWPPPALHLLRTSETPVPALTRRLASWQRGLITMGRATGWSPGVWHMAYLWKPGVRTPLYERLYVWVQVCTYHVKQLRYGWLWVNTPEPLAVHFMSWCNLHKHWDAWATWIGPDTGGVAAPQTFLPLWDGKQTTIQLEGSNIPYNACVVGSFFAKIPLAVNRWSNL